MDTSYSVGMALFDFLPPLTFGLGLVFLRRAARILGDAGAVRLVTLGGGLVFLGGFLKAC